MANTREQTRKAHKETVEQTLEAPEEIQEQVTSVAPPPSASQVARRGGLHSAA